MNRAAIEISRIMALVLPDFAPLAAPVCVVFRGRA